MSNPWVESIRRLSLKIEQSVFEGRLRDRRGHFCTCHDKPISSDGFGMGSYPVCAVTKQDLRDSDIVARALPDLVWNDKTKSFQEEKPCV